MNKLRVAVIGAGHLGKIHTRLLSTQSDIELVAVADPSSLAQQQIAQQFRTETVDDYRSLLNKIDAAVVATPTRTHFDVASELMQHGIHVLIEKPLTDSVSDANALVDLADQHRCIVQVGHVERFNPAVSAAVKEIGQPKFITASRLSGYTFRSTDIGVVHDLMIHDIDLVNSLFPGKAIDTRAVGMSIFGHHEDLTQARIQFSCGGVANLTASRCSYHSERVMQVFGTNGFARIDLGANQATVVTIPSWLRKREIDLLDTTPEQQAFIRENLFDKILPKQDLTFDKTNAILNEQRNWITSIRYRETPHVSIEEGRQAVEIAQSILDSLAAHRWFHHDPATTGPFGLIRDMEKTLQPTSIQTRKAA